MATNVELYRGLCEHIPPEAAKLIADAVPDGAELATKADLEHGLQAVEYRLLAAIHEVKSQMYEMKADMFRWMLTFFASLWVGLAALIVAVLLGG
jgi:hypothetical protein